jgi:hypothetical protein
MAVSGTRVSSKPGLPYHAAASHDDTDHLMLAVEI